MSQRNGEGNQSPGVFLNQRRTPGFSFALVPPRLCRNISDVEIAKRNNVSERTIFLTANLNSKSRYNPHVFTEQGLYMLMTVLKEPLAVKQSKALIRTFKKMKDYILENRDLIGQREILQLSMETANNRIETNKINSDMISLENISRQSRQYMSLTIILA